MSIEQLLAENTAALIANTAALQGVAVTTGTGKTGSTTDKDTGKGDTKSTSTKTSTKDKTAKRTQDEMSAALVKLKDEFGMPEARAIIDANGGGKMADIPAKYFDVIYDAAVKRYDELKEAEGSGDDNEEDNL